MMQANTKVMFMLIVRLKVYPYQEQLLDQHKQEGAHRQRARAHGELSDSPGNTPRFTFLLTTFLAVPITKPMLGNDVSPETSSLSAVSAEV